MSYFFDSFRPGGRICGSRNATMSFRGRGGPVFNEKVAPRGVVGRVRGWKHRSPKQTGQKEAKRGGCQKRRLSFI